MSNGGTLHKLRAWLIFICVTLAIAAHAHDPGLSSATARLQADQLEVTLAFSIKDAGQLAPLDADGDGILTAEEFENAQAKFTSIVAKEFSVELDGQLAVPASARAWFEPGKDAYCALTFPARGLSRVSVESRLFAQLPPGHRQFFSLVGENGGSLADRLLSREANTASAEIKPVVATGNLPQVSGQHSSASFLVLGVEHILTGYDHLLFLFALLVVTNRLGPALKIITCFTVAHSITLALATLSSVQISSRLVEPLIAASIVYVAVENLIRGNDPKGRWLLTFAFGLIHGFGFASVLRELGVGANGSGIAVPLVSFNLGVELGQIMVAAIALPVIWKLRAHPVFVRRWVPACSVVVALAGGYWFTQRVWFG